LKFLIDYTPAKHEGTDNYRNESFLYEVNVGGSIFRNREEKNPAGFNGVTNNNEIKRFRWDRVNEMVEVSV